MDKKVRLTLTGCQRDDTGQENITELSAEAEYYERNGSHYILYIENAAKGDSIKNTIKYKDGLLELVRKGTINTRMVFEKGQVHMTDYVTPYGILRLGIATADVSSLVLKEGMEIQAEYDLTDEGLPLFHCKIHIKIQNMV